MSANRKTSISKTTSYQEIGRFWDSHDLTDFWDQTRPADFRVAIDSETIYCPVESKLAAKLRVVAQKRGVSPQTLVNLWLQKCLAQAEK